MIESAYLLRVLRQVRDRARARAALEGALAGGAAGLGATALLVAWARAHSSPAPWRIGLAIAGGGVALGLAVGAARRISLVRCARRLDSALDRAGPGRDRVLSALALVDVPPTPFSRAAIADAIARAGRLAPKLVAPARRPRGLPALACAALAVGIVALLPARAPGARRDVRVVAPSPTARLLIARGALDAERDAARDARAAAAANGDETLAKLADELAATSRALTTAALDRAEALDALADLAARARQAADEAERARAALRAAAGALTPSTATRPLGRALADDDATATDTALSELAARTASDDAARAGLARALDAAAAAAGATEGAANTAGEPGPRRLARDEAAPGTGAPGGAGADPQERHLEHLRRDLEDAASACRGDAEACARRLRDSEGELSSVTREARDAEARQRLESAVEQARERLRRGDLEGRAEGSLARQFARQAQGRGGGPSGSSGGGGAAERGVGVVAGDDPARADATRDDDELSDAKDPGGAARGDGPGAAGDSAAQGQGAGIGHEAGGDPLGRGATPPTGGREREAHLRGGAGPTRSEVIAASAQRGFATGDYGRVFEDYQPVVEESLAAGAVPEGRRYLVRRYFQLIRPRSAPTARDARAPGAP